MEFEKVVSIKFQVFRRSEGSQDHHDFESFEEVIKIAFPSKETALSFLSEIQKRSKIYEKEEGEVLPYKRPNPFVANNQFESLNFVPFSNSSLSPQKWWKNVSFRLKNQRFGKRTKKSILFKNGQFVR